MYVQNYLYAVSYKLRCQVLFETKFFLYYSMESNLWIEELAQFTNYNTF